VDSERRSPANGVNSAQVQVQVGLAGKTFTLASQSTCMGCRSHGQRLDQGNLIMLTASRY
jgi:hypothetical protein